MFERYWPSTAADWLYQIQSYRTQTVEQTAKVQIIKQLLADRNMFPLTTLCCETEMTIRQGGTRDGVAETIAWRPPRTIQSVTSAPGWWGTGLKPRTQNSLPWVRYPCFSSDLADECQNTTTKTENTISFHSHNHYSSMPMTQSLYISIVICSQVLFHDGSLLHSKVQYTTLDYGSQLF
jgi:hypothetical protein